MVNNILISNYVGKMDFLWPTKYIIIFRNILRTWFYFNLNFSYFKTRWNDSFFIFRQFRFDFNSFRFEIVWILKNSEWAEMAKFYSSFSSSTPSFRWDQGLTLKRLEGGGGWRPLLVFCPLSFLKLSPWNFVTFNEK